MALANKDIAFLQGIIVDLTEGLASVDADGLTSLSDLHPDPPSPDPPFLGPSPVCRARAFSRPLEKTVAMLLADSAPGPSGWCYTK